MLLCDIGNTSYHFLDDESDYKKSVNSFNPLEITQEVFYICVNPVIAKLLKGQKNWIDLAPYVDMKNYYETMGVDRIFACEAVSNVVIVDAGSAITVDVVKEGVFEGGFIYPGIQAMQETYTNISSRLDYSFNFECDLDIMPKNSQDAISYGFLKTLYSEVISHKMDVILTGGDAYEFQKVFKNAKVKEDLIFSGMKKIIKKADLC